MPIPQLKSNFTKRQIGDSSPQFSHRPIEPVQEPKKRIFGSRFIYHKTPRLPKPQISKTWLRKFIKRFWRQLLALVLLGGIFMIGLFAWYSRDLPEPGKIMDRSVALSTKIYDRTGEVLLYEVHGPENRSLVKIDDVPQHVVDATIAIEDKDFYNHGGISIWGIIRGQIVPRLSGNRSQGGSTLTQQFVKNAILTDERKLSRKIKEWILSWQIEKKYDKRQILEFYFNEIPYGGSVYGVEAAARYYFDKSVKASLKTLTFIALILTAVALLTSKFLIIAIWGTEMQKAFVPFNILMAGSLFFFLSSPLSWVLVVRNKQKYLPAVYGIALIFNVVFNIIFIPRYNYLASAAIIVLTEFLVLVALYFLVRRFYHTPVTPSDIR